jgi:hypothetical protein
MAIFIKIDVGKFSSFVFHEGNELWGIIFLIFVS